MKYLLENKFKAVLSIMLVLLSINVFGQPKRPNPPTAVNDFASIFTQQQKAELETNLVQFAAKTSNRIVVVTVNDLEGYQVSDYAVSIGENWGVGSAKFDNGIVILIKPKIKASKGEVFIATGYGLEGVLPDAFLNRTIDLKMIPHFKNNDYYTGLVEALNIIMPIAAGEISHEESPLNEEGRSLLWTVVLLVFLFLSPLILGKKGGKRAGTVGAGGFIIGSSMGSRSSGRSSGGGFGGGFGGGSFGGGGAGGSW